MSKVKLPCPFQAVISGLEMWRFLPGLTQALGHLLAVAIAVLAVNAIKIQTMRNKMCQSFSSVIRIESVIN